MELLQHWDSKWKIVMNEVLEYYKVNTKYTEDIELGTSFLGLIELHTEWWEDRYQLDCNLYTLLAWDLLMLFDVNDQFEIIVYDVDIPWTDDEAETASWFKYFTTWHTNMVSKDHEIMYEFTVQQKVANPLKWKVSFTSLDWSVFYTRLRWYQDVGLAYCLSESKADDKKNNFFINRIKTFILLGRGKVPEEDILGFLFTTISYISDFTDSYIEEEDKMLMQGDLSEFLKLVEFVDDYTIFENSDPYDDIVEKLKFLFNHSISHIEMQYIERLREIVSNAEQEVAKLAEESAQYDTEVRRIFEKMFEDLRLARRTADDDIQEEYDNRWRNKLSFMKEHMEEHMQEQTNNLESIIQETEKAIEGN